VKVLVCGTRGWTSFTAMLREMKRFDPDTTELIEGGCRGADRIACDLARELQWAAIHEYPAQWRKWAKQNAVGAAGPARNRLMLDLKPDVVLAFHPDFPNLPENSGTKDCVDEARKRGITVEEFRE